METLKKILGWFNPTNNTTASDKAGTLATVVLVVVTILGVLCKLGVPGSCVAPVLPS